MKTLYLVVLLVALAFVLAVNLVKVADRRSADRDTNPYEYNVEALKAVKAEFMAYREEPGIAIGLETLHGLAVDRKDRLYVTGDRSLLMMDRQGAPVSTVILQAPATCVTVGPDFRVYVGLSDHVEVFGPDGAWMDVGPSLGSNAVITAIAASTGVVFVADAGSRKVWRCSREGRPLDSFGEKDDVKGVVGFIVPSPYFDLLLDADGSLWVVNPGLHRVENFGQDGYFRRSWGEGGAGIETFCGCCNPTHIARLADGSWITSEKGLTRVKRYDAGGKFVSVVAAPHQFAADTTGLDLAATSDGRILVLDPKARKVRVFVPR